MKITFTDSEFDNYCKKCCQGTYDRDYFPTMNELTDIRDDPVKYLPFIIWLVNVPKDLPKKQKEVKKELYKILYDTVDLVEDPA